MTDRLFAPPGPAVTDDEHRARRAAAHAAQAALDLGDEAAPPPPCPVCAGDHPGPCPHGQALTLDTGQ